MINDDELRSLFRAESEEHLGALEAGLLALEQGRGDSATLDQVFRDAHSLKGAARMLELQDIETLMHGMEELLRSARDQQRPPDAAALEALYAALDSVRQLATEAVTGQPAKVALRAVIDALKPAAVAPSAATAPIPPVAPPARSPPTAPPTSPGTADNQPPLAQGQRSELQGSADQAAEIAINASADLGTDSAPERTDTIRVDARKLDDLLRHCGELIVTQQSTAQVDNGLQYLAADLSELRQDMLRAARDSQDPGRWDERLAGLASRASGLGNRLHEDSEKLQVLTQQIAEGVRNARLLPLSTLFALFPRMVRDIAQQESKQVELVIAGGATSADKWIIEQLKDPLMHILRNAVHHGIEPPEQRRVAGKPERGCIRLSAQRSGSTVRIEISDDGRGVDAKQVRSALHRLANAERDARRALGPGSGRGTGRASGTAVGEPVSTGSQHRAHDH
jgi:two-component system chemotaxis sensor kinase CheA